MNLTDRPGGFRLEDLTRQALTEETNPPQLHLWEVLKALEKAKEDPKVEALFIRGGFYLRATVVDMQPFMNCSKELKTSKLPKNPCLDMSEILPSWITWFIPPAISSALIQVGVLY